jgi:hypothetical protein
MTTQSSTLLRAYLDILNEADIPVVPAGTAAAPAATPKAQVPPIPKLPAQDGDQGDGSVVKTNVDGTKSYAGAFGTFTYDKSGKAIKYASPQFTGVGREVDLTSGDQTTSVNQGPVSVSTTQTPGGYTKQTDAEYDMGMATAGQKTVGPNIAAGQLAGTTTNTVTDKGTGQTKQQVKGVAFGGASGANVGKNYVGSSEDELAQHAAKSVTGGQPPATTVKEEFNLSKSLLEHIEEVENDGPLTSGDYFHIELSEDEGIETWVIAEWSDSVLIEADGATLRLLEESGITFQDELTEADYQGRNVPLGKPMSGDVKKSKVYVKKPNGKVVKVNFGDKKMSIKKSNPKRRKSFRARHNCANPGPRWKARYWSCRAW